MEEQPVPVKKGRKPKAPKEPKAPKITKKMLQNFDPAELRRIAVLGAKLPASQAYQATPAQILDWALEHQDLLVDADIDYITKDDDRAIVKFRPGAAEYLLDLQRFLRGTAPAPGWPPVGVEVPAIEEPLVEADTEDDDLDLDDEDDEPAEEVDLPDDEVLDRYDAERPPIPTLTTQESLVNNPLNNTVPASRPRAPAYHPIGSAAKAPAPATANPPVPVDPPRPAEPTATELLGALLDRVDQLSARFEQLEQFLGAMADTQQAQGEKILGSVTASPTKTRLDRMDERLKTIEQIATGTGNATLHIFNQTRPFGPDVVYPNLGEIPGPEVYADDPESTEA